VGAMMLRRIIPVVIPSAARDLFLCALKEIPRSLRALGMTAVVALLLASPLAAQRAVGDSLWLAGNFAGAKHAYELTLHDDPGSVRALYRLAVLASWDGKVDSALALLHDAREVEPGEPDVRLYEAKMYAWKGDYRAAVIRYDSLLAERPDNRDARFGRAQARAWSGRYQDADREFRALVAADPNDAEALVALAQLRQWQGRTDEAEHYATRALEVAPEDRSAREVRAQIRALRRPRLEAQLGFGHDSDKNNAWWQSVTTSFMAAAGLRTFGSAGVMELSDPVQHGTRLSGEVGATYGIGNLSVTGALGARRLSNEFGSDRSLGTWRTSASYRLSPGAGVGLGYAHYSFDETAFLVGNRIDIDEISADGDAELTPTLSLGVGGGLGFISDDNRRRSFVVALTQRLAQRFTVGVYGRALGYDRKGSGYFAPDRFLVGEARGSYTYGLKQWEGKLSAGVGAQQVGKSGRAQSEWHAEARVARRWATINEVALSGGFSTSAVSSTTGAFRYYTAALSLRVGL
jgi:tetratricopeptide (TPR) repeat protein